MVDFFQLRNRDALRASLGNEFPGIFMHAQSEDGSIVFESIPNFTWQFTDDPGAQRALVQENQGGVKVGLKPCPVLRPMRAEDFLRQALIPKARSGKRVVSVDPLPEFNQMVRRQLGLGPDGAGGQSAVRTDAARARLEYDVDGKTIEEWLTTVVRCGSSLPGAARTTMTATRC
jgi:hypothetical protein